LRRLGAEVIRSRATSRPRRVAARLALLLAGTLVALVIGEIAVRSFGLQAYEYPKVFDANGHEKSDLKSLYRIFKAEEGGKPMLSALPTGCVFYGWYDRPRWSYFDAEGRVEYRLNSLGFRDREFPVARPPGELRVLALGDSFTLGIGVREQDCWAKVLERGLAATRSGPVHVVNGGFSHGYDVRMYAWAFPNHGLQLDPDAVLIGLCLNDVSDSIPLVVARPDPPPILGGRLQLLAVAQRALARLEPEPHWQSPFEGTGPDENREWIACRDGLKAIRETSSQHGIRLVVVIFPMLTHLRSGYPFLEIHKLVGGFCSAHGIECVDLLDSFLGRDERDLWVHPTDQHPNDVGHRLIADALLAYFAKHPLAPREARQVR
jgi:lysophospholipase L1-like esterase